MADKTGTHITAVRTVSVPVTDQDRALEFYVGKLGFEKRLEAPYGDGQRWIEVAPSERRRPSPSFPPAPAAPPASTPASAL